LTGLYQFRTSGLTRKNHNQHPAAQIERLAKILAYQGIRAPIVVSELTGFIAKGHGTLMAIKMNKWTEAPVVIQHFDSEEQEYAFVQSDNAIASWADLDLSGIRSDLGDLGADFDIDLLGIKDFVIDEPETAGAGGTLIDSFGAPPFSVLDTRQGYWQDRKRQWHGMGIKSAKGRDDNLTDAADLPEYANNGKLKMAPGTSVFDPVLAELMYLWFCPPGGTIVDPFAGGSVRGIVASKLNRQYIGVDLRQEQVEENRNQAIDICQDPMPVWHCGDSTNIGNYCADVQADLIFSCPPYADLEVYSDDDRDLSNMDYSAFVEAYAEIIRQACMLLKPDRFAAFVVGEVRDKKSGIYRSFVPDTIEAFKAAGLQYYNEAILLNQAGTAGLRARKLFNASRKMIKVHQNVLVFVKGDPKTATVTCGEVIIPASDESGVGADE
jgi:hypothetical protein